MSGSERRKARATVEEPVAACELCGRTRSPSGRPRHHPGCERLATEPNESYSESLVTPPCDVPVGDEQTLWRIRRAGGGIVVEEVTAKDVTVVHQHAHDIYDIAMSRFNAELHRRVAT